MNLPRSSAVVKDSSPITAVDILSHVGDYTMDSSDVMTVAKVTGYVIYGAVRRKELPALRVGGRLRFRPEDVAAWLGLD